MSSGEWGLVSGGCRNKVGGEWWVVSKVSESEWRVVVSESGW